MVRGERDANYGDLFQRRDVTRSGHTLTIRRDVILRPSQAGVQHDMVSTGLCSQRDIFGPERRVQKKPL